MDPQDATPFDCPDPLTREQFEMLAKMDYYGSGVDWGGTGANVKKKRMAMELIELGYMGGSYRNSYLSDDGRSALKQWRTENSK